MNKYQGKTAITFGVFDLLHFGHFELFRRIRDIVSENGKVYKTISSVSFLYYMPD